MVLGISNSNSDTNIGFDHLHSCPVQQNKDLPLNNNIHIGRFYAIQNFHLAINSSYLNGANWTKQFISRILHIMHLQWIYWNIFLHNRTCRYIHIKWLEDLTSEIEELAAITTTRELLPTGNKRLW
jgi:hypothetical protein